MGYLEGPCGEDERVLEQNSEEVIADNVQNLVIERIFTGGSKLDKGPSLSGKHED